MIDLPAFLGAHPLSAAGGCSAGGVCGVGTGPGVEVDWGQARGHDLLSNNVLGAFAGNS